MVSERAVFNESLYKASQHRQQLEQQVADLRAAHDAHIYNIRQACAAVSSSLSLQADHTSSKVLCIHFSTTWKVFKNKIGS